MLAKGTGPVVLVLASAVVVGGLAAWQPRAAVGLCLLLPLVVILTNRGLHELDRPRLCFAALFIAHMVTALRWSWFDTDIVPIFKYLRLPVTVGTTALLLLLGTRRLGQGGIRRPAAVSIGYIAALLILGLFGLDPRQTWFYGIWLGMVVVSVAVCIGAWDRPVDFWRTWLAASIAFGLLVCGASLLTSLAGVELAAHNRYVGGVLRPGYRGILSSPNIMGTHGALLMGSVLGWRLLHPEEPRRPSQSVLLVLGLAIAMMSLSRAALAAASATIAAFLWLGRREDLAVGRTAVAASVAAAAALLLSWLTGFGWGGIERVLGVRQAIETGEDPRIFIWQSYLSYTAQHPIVGTGFGNSSMMGDYVALRTMGFAKASHSLLVEYVLEPGLLAGALFIWLLVLWWRGLRHHPNRRLAGSVMVLTAAAAPSALSDTMASTRAWAPYLVWVLLLFGAALHRPPRAPA